MMMYNNIMVLIRKNIKIIIALSFSIIVCAVVWFFVSKKNLPRVDYMIGNWHGDHAVWIDNGYTVSEEIKDSGETVDFIWGPYDLLKKGSYTAHIEYSAEEDQSCQAISARRSFSQLIDSSKAILSKNLDAVDYQFEVREDIDEFMLMFRYSGEGGFSVNSINITPDTNRIKRLAALVILSVLLVDFLCFLFIKYEQHKLTIIFLLLIFALSSLPLAVKGLFVGHDINVHLLRIEAIVQALRSKQFPARVSSMVLFGYGYPFSIYYNDLFLYLPAVFRLLGFSVASAYKIYVLFINFAKVMIAWYSFHAMTGKKKNALIMTLLYATASYRFTNVYVRAAVGEYTAQIFLPLFGLAVKRIFFDDQARAKEIMENALILAAAMSGCIGSHIPTTVMSCFILLLICVFYWKRTFRKQTILSLTAAVFLTLLVNLYYLVPMADYYFNVPTTISSEVDGRIMLIQGNGVQPAQIFSFFQSVSGNADCPLTERLQATPGLPLMLVLALGIYLFFRNKTDPWFRCSLLFSVLTIWLSTDTFFWNGLTLHVPGWRVLVQMIQFPWRFFEFSILFITALISGISVREHCR